MKKLYLISIVILLLVCTVLFTSCGDGTKKARDISNDSAYASSILYSSELKNKVQCTYDNDERHGYLIENSNTNLELTLSNGDMVGLSKISTSSGKTLLEGGMTAFAVTEGGNRFTTSNSMSTGRVNTNKMGYYYYEANLRSLSLTQQGEEQKSFEKISDVIISDVTENNKVDVSLDENCLTGKINSKGNVSFSLASDIDISSCHTIAYTITYTGKATTGYLYYYTSEDSNDSFQGFSIRSGERMTIYATISALNYDGLSVNSLEFKFKNAGKGDTFVIDSFCVGNLSYEDIPELGFEETFHTYSDKIVNDVRIIYDTKTSQMAEFGYEYDIPKKTVSDMYIDTESKQVAFKIKQAGILGFVLEPDDKTTLTVISEEDYYKVIISIDISGEHKAESDSATSHMIYTSEEKNFNGFITAAYNERNPLSYEVLSQSFDNAGFEVEGYNTETGSYDLAVNGCFFNYAYYKKENNNISYGGKVCVTGDAVDRNVYFRVNGNNGCLEAAVLLDQDEVLLPIEPEVCKNFVGENEESYYEKGDAEYGVTVFPLVIEANETYEYTMLNIYQNWGNSPLKQISSISFHIGYYHLSTGVTESNCIAPYFVYGRDGWTLPDFRGCSGNMWGSQPQFNSVGRPRFVNYLEDGSLVYGEYTGSKINSSGPCYADIEYSYSLMDGDITYTLRHVEFPQNDENRTYYTLSLTFNDNVTFEDARNTFTLFNFDGRFGSFKNMSYKDENGEIVTLDVDVSNSSDKTIYTLSKDNPFVSLFNTTEEDIENFGFIVKSYDITVGKKTYNGSLCVRHQIDDDLLNFIEIGIDADTLKFKKGDTINMYFILLPYGVANQTNDDNVDYVIEDSVDNPWRVSEITTGTILEDGYLARLTADNNAAEFTVTGGRNANVVRIDGFSILSRPTIEKLVEGEWVEYDFNFYDYDGYQVSYTDDGYYSYSFVINQENFTDKQTFRVSIKNK